jgi:hypothetical protein
MEGEETTLKVARKDLVLPVTMGTIRTIIAAGNVSKWDILPVDTEESTPPIPSGNSKAFFSIYPGPGDVGGWGSFKDMMRVNLTL